VRVWAWVCVGVGVEVIVPWPCRCRACVIANEETPDARANTFPLPASSVRFCQKRTGTFPGELAKKLGLKSAGSQH
jgi:hypothetical protein